MRLVSVLVLSATLTAALTVAACQPAGDEPAASDAPEAAPEGATTPDTGVGIAADSEGLRLVNLESGSTRLLAFGSPADQAIAALDAATGAAGVVETSEECPSGEFAGPVDYVRYDGVGLTVLTRDGQFIGWTADGPTISTMDGIAPGSTYAAVQGSGGEAAESSLGYEGQVNGLGFLLEQQGGPVSTLFAGSTCFAR